MSTSQLHPDETVSVAISRFTSKHKSDIDTLVQLADEMASTACAMHTNQGYVSFINARKSFLDFLHSSASNYVRVDPN